MKKIVVVGGGAAGMMAAITAAQNGAKVTLLEKMPRVGQKMLITGKGRCNLTNAADTEEIIKNIPGNGKFLYSVLRTFDSEATWRFFTSAGVPLKIERGRRVFPVSDRAADVVTALFDLLTREGVDLHLGEAVKELFAANNRINGVRTDQGFYDADGVILATGGKSYPRTGSEGDGYILAQKLGHRIMPLFPALVPLETEEDWVAELTGLSLKNVRATLMVNEKKIAAEFGEMLFTHFGVSGPIILSLSRQAAMNLRENNFVELSLDLKPALTPEQMDKRLERDFVKYTRKQLKNGLVDLLPQKLIPPILDLAFLSEDKFINSVTATERRRLAYILKNLPITVSRARPLTEAIVTAGGVCVKEINPKTMESKIISGLYFAGEVVDVDGLTGGYNLQAAFAMGAAAGKWSAV